MAQVRLQPAPCVLAASLGLPVRFRSCNDPGPSSAYSVRGHCDGLRPKLPYSFAHHPHDRIDPLRRLRSEQPLPVNGNARCSGLPFLT